MIPVRQRIGGLGNLMFKEAYILGKMFDGEVPDQYVQDYRYWLPHKDRIISYFFDGIDSIDKVGIHVRRGDYVGSSFHADLFKTDYYQRAMSYFPNDKFLVFSDDIEWCKMQPLFKDCEFSEGKSEVEDLNLLASCKSIIMANSTFSWWATFLNPRIHSFEESYDENKRGLAFRPEKWFVDGKERITFPPGWISVLEKTI